MKTLNKFATITLLFLGSVFFMTSCSKNETEMAEPVSNNDLKYVTTSSGGSSVTLFAGQSINVGTVSFDDVDTNNDNLDDALQVTYTLTGGWQLVEIHYWMGATLSLMPTNKAGNPVIGQFPFAFSPTGQTSYSFIIPFTSINYTCASEGIYFVASHASVRLPNGSGYQNESAWGDGQRLTQRGNWAMYYNIDITCDPTIEPEEKKTETAFAHHAAYAQTFISVDSDLPSNRWGWTNGPLAPGNYTFTLYAGAGNNVLSNGVNVGTVTLNYTGSTATATFQTIAPYKLEEAHLYIGSSILPLKNGEYTVAPGQFPKKGEDLAGATSYTFNVTNLSGNVYLVAHATVSGF